MKNIDNYLDDELKKILSLIEEDAMGYEELCWRTVTGYKEPQLLLWVKYWELGDFVSEFSDYFATENEYMANLQQDSCCINLSELFDQENDFIEEFFPKDEDRKAGWIE